MKFSNLAALCVAAVVCLLICGCGDTFRPVATPLPLPSPNPTSIRFATFTSCQVDPATGDCSTASTVPDGASTDIDVAGDTLVAITPVGRSPVNALVESPTSGFSTVVTADRDSDTVTSYTLSTLSTSTTASAPNITGLPSGARPTSLVNANGTVYVTESGRNVIAVLGGSPFSISAEVPVGANPVNVTVLPNGKKIYVANQGDNSVTVIDASDNSVVTTVFDPNASSPIFAVPSADSTHVFVVNQASSNVTVIDATSDSVVATLSLPAGSLPNRATVDRQNQRVVITNPGTVSAAGAVTAAGTVSVINADPTSPLFLSVTNIPVGINPRSATALADGTRIYVANTNSHSITVINSLSLTASKTISLITSADPIPSPISISSDAESQKVLVANRDSQDISVINTSSDTELTDLSGNIFRIPAPQVDLACVSTPAAKCAQLSPIFIAVGPG